MNYDEAIRWCSEHGATWGLSEGPVGSSRRLWLKLDGQVVELAIPGWIDVNWRRLLTEVVERMAARMQRPEAA
jgi:hypothetical protein